MADKPSTSSKEDISIDETKSGPPPQGPSNIIKVTTKEGKTIVVKREGDAQVQYEHKLEKPDLKDFKQRPIEKFKEASQRKYDVVGITMEKEYDEITESDEEREVAKLSKREQEQYQEMKDLMTIQGRLKGHVPGFGVGISTYVTGRYPGVPSELIKPYVIEEEGKKADILTRLPPAQIDSLIQEHDRKIPRRDVVVRPGRRGITMSIDLNSDDKIYEISAIEDSLEDVIKLTGKKKEGAVKEVVSEQKEKKDQPSTSISITDDRVLVPDVVSQGIADDYSKEEKLEDSDAETISLTSTADYDREEAEDLLDKISSWNTALATHYNKMNEIVPHMTKTQLAQYLGKVHILNIVKPEGVVSKTYTSEPDTSEIKFVVRGETHEERLQELVNTVPAHQLMLAIAIGDIHLNKLSYDQASQKYQLSKSHIQRAISGKTEHKKGGKQYQQERKRKAEPEASTSTKKSKDDNEDNEEEEAQPAPACFQQSKEQDILPDLVDDNDDQFPEVKIDA